MRNPNLRHPGVYIPPPLIYAAFFLLSLFIQRIFPLNNKFLITPAAHILAWAFLAVSLLIAAIAIRKFAVTKNTLITVKAATSLQTSGIYSFTRNPMYLGLILLYISIAIFYGNWWTFFLLSLLIFVIQFYVIQKEEQYLRQAFGEPYDAYRKKVRRWI